MVITQSADRTAHAGLVQEREQRDHQHSRHDNSGHVLLLQQKETAEGFKDELTGGDTQLFGDHDLVLAAENKLAKADQEQRDPDSCHEQDDVRLAHQRAEDNPFNADRQHEHHPQRQDHRDPRWHTHFMKTHKGQRGKHHHDPLGKVKDTARPEDQHKPQRDQRIKDT